MTNVVFSFYRMLIAMVTIFGVSWLPLTVINLINDVYIPTGNWRYYTLCFFMVHSLAMSSTCYNPFLYAWLNDNFRKEFKQVKYLLIFKVSYNTFYFQTDEIQFSMRDNWSVQHPSCKKLTKLILIGWKKLTNTKYFFLMINLWSSMIIIS